MTRTQTTYHETRMMHGEPIDPRGANCETLELARNCNIPGEEVAIIRTEWRLGGDGAWHDTLSTIVEWEVR